MKRIGMVAIALLAGAPMARAADTGQDAVEAAKAEENKIETEAAQLAPKDKENKADSMVGEIRDAHKHVSDLLDTARNSHDIVQLNCVNEKLTLIKGLEEIAQKSSSDLYDAVAANAMDRANTDFVKVVVAHAKTLILRAQADQCVGENAIYAGETEVQVEIEASVANVDPTVLEPPPSAPVTPQVATKS